MADILRKKWILCSAAIALGLVFFIIFRLRPALVFDIFAIFFLLQSILLLISLFNNTDLIDTKGDSRLGVYFATRAALLLLLYGLVSSSDSSLPKSLMAFINLAGGEIAILVMFLFSLIVYWQVVSKGLARYGEIVARFFLDALPGQQMGIEAKRRDGLISPRVASSERDLLVEKSLRLGTLDASLRLSLANVLVILLSLGLYSFTRIYFSWESQSNIPIIRLLGEVGGLGFWLVLDAILFFAPYAYSLRNKSLKTNTTHLFRGGSNSVTLASALLLLILAMLSLSDRDLYPWEALMLVAIFLLSKVAINKFLRDPSAAKVINYSLKSNTIKLGDELPDEECNADLSIFIASNVLENFYNEDGFTRLIAEIRQNRDILVSTFGSIDIRVQVVSNIDDIVLKYTESSETAVSLPYHKVPLGVHICFAKSVFATAQTNVEHYFPYQAWVDKKELALFAGEGFPVEVCSPYKLVDVLLAIINQDPKAAFLREVSVRNILEESHDSSLDSRSELSVEKLLLEFGIPRIMSIVKNLALSSNYRLNVRRLIDACFLSEDDNDDSIVKEYLRIGFRDHSGEYVGGDGICRVVMLSQGALDDSYESGTIDLNTKSNSISVVDNLVNISRRCSERGVSPLLVLYSSEERRAVDAIAGQLGREARSCLFIEQGHMSKENEFLPLFRR